MLRFPILIIIVGSLSAAPGFAQHPIDIQRLAAEGEYYQALHAFFELPKRRATTETTLAAARAAWALSLPNKAISYFDTALADEALSGTERSRIYLARSIIEYQEERYRVAIVYAERAAALIPDPAPLRGRVWQIWGDSLYRLASYAAAEKKYKQAIAELETEDLPVVNYQLGVCRRHLGRYDLAREAFEQVPLNHAFAADAVRHLARLALDSQRYSQARFWLETGRDRFPDSFLDSWVDYALIRIAIHQGESGALAELLRKAEERHPPSDYWLTLAQSATVAHQWKVLMNRGIKEDVEGKGAVRLN